MGKGRKGVSYIVEHLNAVFIVAFIVIGLSSVPEGEVYRGTVTPFKQHLNPEVIDSKPYSTVDTS